MYYRNKTGQAREREMPATMTRPKFRYIGVTDDCIECQCCGKPNLKSTIVLAHLDEDGNDEETTYYGSSCAARALGVKGGSASVRKSAIWARETTVQNAKDARARLAYYNLPEAGEPEDATFRKAVIQFRRNNYSPYVPEPEQPTWDGWQASTRELLAIWQRQIADAKLIGWN